MTKVIITLLLIISTSAFDLKSQVTIGSDISPESASLLDIKTKDGGAGQISSTQGGLLLPRVSIDTITNLSVFPDLTTDLTTQEQKLKHKGLTVYNINNNHEKNIEEGTYIWSGYKWEKSTTQQRLNFFYMPPVAIPANSVGVQPPIDLYTKYREQFKTPLKKSTGAPDEIPFYWNRQDLYYYVLDCDGEIFDTDNMSITEDGWLNYSIKKIPTDGPAYINIVFAIK